jgi:large subunit ribosomal protein L21
LPELPGSASMAAESENGPSEDGIILPHPLSRGLTMYAIIRAGGKQAKVKAGDVIEIERVKDAADSLTFTPIMVVGEDGSTMTDRDSLSDVKVVAEVLGETKGDKIDIFKYKNKTGYRRHLGHRQTYTQIRVTSIDLPKEKSSKAQSTKAGATKSSSSTEAQTGKQTEED